MKNTLYDYENNFDKIKEVDTCLVIGDKSSEVYFFSIVIPTFNRTDLLKEAIDSALNQKDFSDYEIVVVDNNPEVDNNKNRSVIEKYKNKKIKYYINRENIGMVGNWNRCIELSNGKYIVMLHDDDVISPFFLSEMSKILNSNSFSVVGVDYRIFKNKNELVFAKSNANKLIVIDKVGFFFGESVNIAGITFSKDIALKIGGFNPSDYPNSDTYFIYKAILYGKVANLKCIMAGYRIEKNETLKNNTLIEIIKKMYLMRKMIGERERFARYFLKMFEDEFILDYMVGAEKYWNIKFEESEILSVINNFKYDKNRAKLMRLTIKILKNKFVRRCIT